MAQKPRDGTQLECKNHYSFHDQNFELVIKGKYVILKIQNPVEDIK